MESGAPQILDAPDENMEISISNDAEQMFKKPQIGPAKGKSSLLHKYLQQKKIIKTPEIPKEAENLNDGEKVEISVHISEESVSEPDEGSRTKPSSENVCNYVEPSWKGIPVQDYKLEELKSGVIQRTIDLTEKSSYIFGRLESCDIAMLHPTISRHHAVLQYRSTEEEGQEKGFYLYDLGSTHGTFLNKSRIKPRIYIKIKVGHVLKLGCSTRLFILHGPPEDEEEESEFTVSQLKEKRRVEMEQKKQKEEEQRMLAEMEEERRRKAFEERGVDWGMGEDADEETDLSENPFAVTTNEELYIDDPKKTLRGWFEREGEELTYDVEQAEKGTFCCKIVLPIDNGAGHDVVVEVMGKSKKEAMVQCALEACRHIDRQGLLRQSHHESRKRQTKNWEENDFYDSDEDNFLDRTGQIERKREKRMRKMGKIQDTVETYDSLMEKHKAILEDLQKAENKLHSLKSQNDNKSAGDDEDVDALDAFMQNLNHKCPSKLELKQCQQDIIGIKKEEERLRQLVNIAKPANLPELKLVEITAKPKKSDGNINKEVSVIVSNKSKTSGKSADNENAENKQKSTSDSHIKSLSMGPQLPTEDELQDVDKKKKRSRPRNRQKPQKEPEVSTSFDEDYNNCVWTPPKGQTGDGRTTLNDKLGY